jgi:uncharacterized damage-inducible protein DinB
MNPELDEYTRRLRHLRKKALRTLEGLGANALNWRPLPDEANSLYALATHVCGSEHGWIAEVLGQAPKTRVRSEEFIAQGENAAALLPRYEQAARETEEILSRLTDADLNTTLEESDRGTITYRWIILHVIEHSAEHLGQMLLTRQLWENQTNLNG